MVKKLYVKTQEEYDYFLTMKNNGVFMGNQEGHNAYSFGDFTALVPESMDKKVESSYNDLIFGKDPRENIVSIEIKDDKAYLYKSDGSVDIEEYNPWLLGSTKTNGALRLKGNQYYNYIKRFKMDEYLEKIKEWNPRVYKPRSIEEGYMTLTGTTYFKGMKVSDVSVLSFDIEATGVNKDEDSAETIMIANTFRNRKGEYVRRLFDVFNYSSGKEMIADWCSWVNEMDPDIMIGHNILGYDFGYMHKTGGSLPIGRDGSDIEFSEKEFKVTHAGLDFGFTNVRVFGREVIDTMILSMKHDFANNFPSYGLKAIEKHLKLVDDNRVEWDWEKNPTRKYKSWTKEVWNEFIRYAEDDSDSPIKMFDIMVPAFFYLNQSIPKSLQDIINQRSGSQIDSMMIRSYLQHGHSQPRTSQKEKYKGAISMGIPGAYKHVRKFDVASLYPSIMLEQEIYDKEKDPKRNMLNMLEYFRDERLKNKALAAEGSQYHDDLQAAQKIVINSMYGFLGATYLLYNYMDGADAVTARGREILQIAVEWACGFRLVEEVKKIVNKGKENEKVETHWVPGPKISEGLGFELVNVDTDAISISNGKAPTKEEFDKQITDLNSNYSDWIDWEDDGVFQNFLVVGAKNYVIQRHENWANPKKGFEPDGTVKVKFKGSSITDSKKEPILKKFMMDSLSLFVDDSVQDKTEAVHELYMQTCQEALNFNNVKDWTVKRSVSKKILAADKTKDARMHETKPLKAIKQALEAGVIESIQEGDKIWIYTAILGEEQKLDKDGNPDIFKVGKQKGQPKMEKVKGYKFHQLYDKDHDELHYLTRVYKTFSIFSDLVDKTKFIDYGKKTKRKLLDAV